MNINELECYVLYGSDALQSAPVPAGLLRRAGNWSSVEFNWFGSHFARTIFPLESRFTFRYPSNQENIFFHICLMLAGLDGECPSPR
jgi:hypothetical protein